MQSIFGKSGSTAGRAKTRHKSIRGTISAPIPMPKTPDDDEFPIRNQGSAKASITADDEFPIRNQGSAKASITADDEFPMRAPGSGIAMPLSPTDHPGPSPVRILQLPGEPVHNEQQQQQQQQPRDLESSPANGIGCEQEQEDTQLPPPLPAASTTPVDRESGGSRTDLAREIRPEPPSTPLPAPQSGSNSPPGRSASRPASRSPSYQPSPRKTSPLGVSPSRVSPPARRATNPVLSTVRYSTISDAPSKQTTQSKYSPLQKKSTLRSAIGRLFGRGKKKNGTGNQDVVGVRSERESRPLGSAQHRSDPTALGRPYQRSPKRSASLPLSEFDRPLRSHSIGPGDIMAIESARNSLQAEAVGPGSSAAIRRRAATAGGHNLLRPHLFNREFGAGLSPRPSSAQGRASRTDERADPDDSGEIGRAITSDSGGLRRRSRSLSGLQNFAGIQRVGRRRSDEIRYWRESYDPGFMSPLSSNAPDDFDDAGMVETSAPDSPAAERPPKTPPQPFNFGVLSKEMVGMKITHAADMDMRLGNLESRTIHLERAVDKLYHVVPGVKGRVDPKDTVQPTDSQRSLESDARSHASFGEYLAGSLQPPSYSTTNAAVPRTIVPSPLHPQVRPTSTSTVRGVASLPLLNREAGPRSQDVSQDELIAQLRTNLDAERAARQVLEAQVKKLSERLNTLSTTMFAMVRSPSESRSQERLAPSSVGGGSPLLLTPRTFTTSSQRQQQLSIFETDEDDDEDDDAAQSKTLPSTKTDILEEGEITEDDFQTPREERTPMLGYGAFGEQLRPDADDDGEDENNGGAEDEDEHKRKKAARTLSLSQLTLAMGQRTRI